MIGIYKITSPSGKVYIGQSWTIEKRQKSYEWANCTNQKILCNSIKKHGWESHYMQILHEFPDNCTQEHLNYAESFYWRLEILSGSKMMNCIVPGSRGKSSEETKQKQRISMSGKTHSEESKEKIRIARTERPNRGGTKNKGISRSPENRKKISDSLKARTDNKGEFHNMAKLSEIQVLEIRNKYIPKEYGCKKLAKEYNMSKTSILDIINRKTWNNI